MTTIELLSKLHELGIELRIDGEHLRLNARKGVVSATLKEEIANRKEEILDFLKTAKIEDQTISSLIPTYERNGALRLSFSQERLWLMEQLSPGNYAYNIPGAIRLKGALNLTCLEQALNEILARHEVLRANFDVVDDQPVQIIAPPQLFPLKVINLSQLPPVEQTVEARRLTEEEAKQPFDLSKDLLVRATLLKLDEGDHVFLLTIHHIVSDGWSRRIFTHEFVTLYQAFLEGKPNPLPPLPVQYTDFARWQREWLQGKTLESQLAYWKQQLGGDLPQLELLLDKPRPPVQSLNSAQAIFHLPSSLIQSLKILSQEENATLFMTLLAAFKLLLQRFTGLEDIIVGSPIAGRNRAEVENLIGCFINTLVLRTDLSGNPSFRELIQRVRKTAMDAYTHQDIPFEKLLVELHPERNLSHTPLFQVFFNMLNLEGGQVEMPGLSVEILDPSDIGSKFDLTLYLIEKGQAIDLNLVYNTDLFTSDRIEELLAQYELLLEQVMVHPDQKIADYSLLTNRATTLLPNPTQELPSTWKGAIPDIFTQQAIRLPEQIALLDTLGSWTYQQLDSLSSQLAHYLQENGVQSQDVVAVYGHRSASLIWALLGILKAGAAFVILDPVYPSRRLVDYLRLAQPKVWLQLESAGTLPTQLQEFVASSVLACQLVLPATMEQADLLLREYPLDGSPVTIGPEDLAYIAFTSGSTGHPKGILGTHSPLSHFIHWHTDTFGLNPADRFSMLSGLAHDPLLRDIFTPLCLGATLCIPDQEQMLTPGQLRDWMKQQNISVTHLTPALQQVLVITTSDDSQSQLPNLRYAFFGGEPLTQQHVSSLTQLAPNVTCVNFYGATETPQAMSYTIVDLTQSRGIIPLGNGIQDVQLIVLNSVRQIAGIGELGEIFIRTPYLSRGYLQDDVLTQRRFLTNPFTNDQTDRMYKTGDLGRYLPNGEVEFLGRNDTQVKIRGFRIELIEIESVIASHPAVRQAVVSLWETKTGDKRLAAYIVPDFTDSLQIDELRNFIKAQLPDYMIPANFITLDAIPLTPNGKVDRKALPNPDKFIQKTEKDHTRPRTETEENIASIWTDILGKKEIGVYENFFDLGGHSLLATRVISQIREQFRIDLPLRTLFVTPTIAEMSEAVDTILWATQMQSSSRNTGMGAKEGLEI